MFRIRHTVPVLVVIALLVSSISAVAQQRGSISGKVVDPDGLAVPGASITVTEQSTGFNRTAVSADKGVYTITNLDPGTYTISVELSGFGTVRVADVRLSAGNEMVMELKMQLAGVQEAITVTGQSP